jgi:hypothetical protein
MATWIVHLRLAEDLLGRIPGLDAGQFAIGNVAPDSGIPDEKWENFDPPSEVTHFHIPGDVPYKSADLAFYRRCLQTLDPSAEPARFSFRLGYFFHLVTDNLWSEQIGRPTRERFAEQFAADRDFIWEVKKDWYGLDFIFVRDHPDCLYWRVFLDAQPSHADLDFLRPDALQQQLDYIKAYYQRTDEKVQVVYQRPFSYLSRADADRFVQETTRRLERIHQALWVERLEPPGEGSALSLVD